MRLKLVKAKIGWQHISMKFFFVITLFLGFSGAFAQSDTSVLYTDAKLKEVKPELAKFIFKGYQKDSSSWIFLKYDEKKVLLLRETYADANFTIRNGFYYEYKNGKPVLRGLFVNNKREGNFTSFDSLGKTTAIDFYKQDSLKGTGYSFWPNGNKMREKTYGNKEMILQSTLFYENGSMAIKEIFSDKGELIEGVYLDSTGNRVKKLDIESPPTFPGGIEKFYEFLGRNIRYPQGAFRSNIQGNVHVSFIVSTDGSLEEIKVERRLFPTIDQEAMRVVQMAPKWIPGKIMGRPVRIKYSLPIKFSLNQGY